MKGSRDYLALRFGPNGSNELPLGVDGEGAGQDARPCGLLRPGVRVHEQCCALMNLLSVI